MVSSDTVELMPHFAMYWRPSTVEAARATDDLLLYAASNQFDRVASGDVIWLVTAPGGRLSLVGRLNVDAIVDGETATARLGVEKLWPAELYALPPQHEEREPVRDLDLTEHAAELRFVAAEGEAALAISHDGRVNAQQLQTMRVLTPESAQCLERLWSNRARCLKLVTDAATVRANVEEFNAAAAGSAERARSLLSATEYWVFDEASNLFGPGKFVGYERMSFELYEAAHRGDVTGARFDGYVTRKALESALGAFIEDATLADRLDSWLVSLAGEGAPDIDRTKWRFVRVGASASGTTIAAPSAPPKNKKAVADDAMYDCEARLLFVENGAKVWRWETRAVKAIGDDRDVRCMHCHGVVRLHRQKVPHGPADHVVHVRRRDSEYCRGGHYFKGEHRLSDEPVT
jgi:hypothetical protein